jgi:hypothetical protein
MNRRRLFTLAALLLLAMQCLAQGNEIVVIRRPVKARFLSGIVAVADQPLKDVHVEECDPAWNYVLASTTTDDEGRFRLTPAAKGRVHYLRIYAPAYDISEYTVKLSRHGPAELHLELHVGT